MAEIAELEELTGEFESVTADIAKEDAASEKTESALDTLPERYRGKTVAELAKWYEESEKKASRLGNEVHEVRKLADELLKSQLTRKAEEDEPDEVDFFENPQEAMRQAIANNPQVRQAEEYGLQAQRQFAKQSMEQKHPDVAQIVQDPEFQEWIGKSKVRMHLFQAAENYDFDAGDELLSTFKELRGVRQQQVTQVDTKARDNALSAAAVDTSGTSEVSRKVYRRADLIRLKMQDPDRYEAMGDEILKAYAEDRVR